MTGDAQQDLDRPAILGGAPVRPEGPPEWPFDDPEVAAILRQCIAERTWGKYHGPNSQELTERLADYHECEHVVLCASGTAAIELALRGLKVGAGDEVIVAAYDFKGNFQNVLTVGATPVLVDVNPHNWNLDTDKLADAITPATKAIIVSHLHGGIVPMSPVIQLAEQHNIAVIEDACQMPGAVIEGRTTGTAGDVGVLSFGGSKLLSAGRGGALLTNNADIVQRARLYSHRGNEAYPLSELQAAVLLPQLRALDGTNKRRAENVLHLIDGLSGQAGIVPFRNPDSPEKTEPGYYKLGFQYDPAEFADLPRDTFAKAMRAEGIALDPGFRALHVTHSRRRFRASGVLANATDADNRVLTLHHPILQGSAADVVEIIAAIEKLRRHAATLARKVDHPNA